MALVLFVFFVLSVCSVRMNASLCYFYLVLSCGVKVVSPCCRTRRWRNNLNEPLDPFPFWVAAE